MNELEVEQRKILARRIAVLEVERDNLKSYVSHTEAAEKWYLDGEITWKEFAKSAEKGWKRAEAEVERLKSEIRMLKLLNPESPKSTRRWG